MRIRTLLLLFLLFLSGTGMLMATHNRAGEITYVRIAPFTKIVAGQVLPEYNYLITVTKYTDHGESIADRCVDTVYFGDNERGVAPRINGKVLDCRCGSMNGVPIGCGELIIEENDYIVKLNTYTITHTYAGPGNYLIRSFDPNRNQGVVNIPNSVNLPFYIESLLIINGFTGANSSPVFKFAPIDRACVSKCFEHNPGAYDPDKDDSLSFEISTSRGVNGTTVPGYFYPQIPAGGNYGIDPVSGLLSWCTPQLTGEYNIAFLVKEWRKTTSGKYQLIGYIFRDMQVIVGNCPNNDPPQIVVPADTCVEAGTLIEKNIIVSDPNIGNTVTLEGGGGPFLAPPPIASLNPTVAVTSSASPSFTSKFRWQTSCDHIRKQPYQATFKALDNGIPVKLPTFRSYRIRVVPPAIKSVTAVPAGSEMKLSWEKPVCQPKDNPLGGFRIYRKNDCTTLIPVPCQTGAPSAAGFSLVGQTAPGVFSFTDNNGGDGLVVGQNYSYLVVAYYFDGTESFASTAVCAELKRDVPVILNVDVEATAKDTGIVHVRWTRPLTTGGNLDTVAFPGPYQFLLKHKTGNGGYEVIFTSSRPFVYQLDTFYAHENVNTVDSPHDYIIEFISGTVSIGSSRRATSVYLKLSPNDRRMQLDWSFHTPWDNKRYTVYRQDPGSQNFVQIGVTTTTTYTDTMNVVNRHVYCYRVLSEGEYSDPGIFKPLLNRSQVACDTVEDLTPPCTPSLSIQADCPKGFVGLAWNDVRERRCGDDVIRYRLFRKTELNGQYTKVAEGFYTSFVYDGLEEILGCYAVVAIDSSGNESPMSPDFCIDNCPEFELPNLFSPNGDNANDHYKAIKVRQVKEIDLNIVDRWGNLIYSTADPYFMWDGKSQLTKQDVNEGTYFYVCHVFEPRLSGVVRRTIRGYLQVVR